MIGYIVQFSILLTIHVLAQTPPGYEPSSNHELYLEYPGEISVFPGISLELSDTKCIPTLSTLGLSRIQTYIVFLIDIDVILEPNATTILHWYQPDLKAQDLGSHLVNTTNNGAAYLGPHPPAGNTHRYVFLLFQQPQGYTLPSCFSTIFPETVEARAGFNIDEFIEVAGLGDVVAANYVNVTNPATPSTTLTATTTSLSTAPCPITMAKFLSST
uniref:Phosphatidylethanolamine-binding protein-like protein n=1 Tax=Paecilomyces fulvus TaxID=89137 RepID=A0A172WCT9_9EURO|nr:phosphatidylethanolamine-binding protein-like protein [Paecilomyces fulvus]